MNGITSATPIVTNPTAERAVANDSRASTLFSGPTQVGGLATATDNTDIPVTSTERVGDAALPVQQSAGNEAVPVDAADNSTTCDSVVVLPGVKESPRAKPKAKVGKRPSKGQATPNISPASTNNAGGLQGDASNDVAPPPLQKSPQAPSDPHPISLDAIVQELWGGHLRHVNGCFMTSRGGHWGALHQAAEVQKPIATLLRPGAKAREINEIVKQLKLRYAEISLPAPVPNLVCVQNGTLNLLTGELLDHSPDHWLRYKIDNPYDPDAKCPIWLRTLDETFRDSIDKAQKILLLKQWFGCCIVPMTRMRKFLVMHGAGSNGKSVILSILARLVGEANLSRAMVERIGKKEVLADFDGKLLNITPELSNNAWRYSNYIKAVVDGEDHVQARKLYKNVISFRPITRLVMATNVFPRVVDDSDAFFNRLMILVFERQFTEAEQNKQLINELHPELPGILAWAVEGLQQLVADGQFVIPASSDVAKNRYRIDSDDARLFLDECLELDPTGSGMTVPVVYANYCKWCSESGLTAMNKFTFGKRFRLAGAEQRHTRTGDIWLVGAKAVPVPSESNPEQPQQEVNMAT